VSLNGREFGRSGAFILLKRMKTIRMINKTLAEPPFRRKLDSTFMNFVDYTAETTQCSAENSWPWAILAYLETTHEGRRYKY
jgi:hypothetical protein